MEKLLDVFKFRDAQKEAMNLARMGNKYLADTEPWKLAKTDMERVATIPVSYTHLSTAESLLAMAPVCELAARLPLSLLPALMAAILQPFLMSEDA